MKSPLITVYITNYNYEKYIRQSIESVLNQTLSNFELFIIDDGSKDDSREIIEEYRGHEKITIIYQQNKGLNITNNVAMRASSGKYLMRLDADDFLEPDALEKMSIILEKDNELGLVFPDYFYVDKYGNKVGEERRHNFEKEVSLYDQPAHGACTMIRLEFLKKLGGYNESFTCQDGYDLWIKFIMHHKVTNINQPLFSYRRHGENLTTNEQRILSTRKKIKDIFVENHALKTPATVAIIPVRNTYIKGINWPLFKYKGKTIIEHAVAKAIEAERVNWVVITSADQEVLDFLEGCNFPSDKVMVIARPAALAQVSESLTKTFQLVLDELQVRNILPQALMSISLEYPFLTSEVIDDAVNTLSIFKSDSLLSVRPDNRMYYQHIGHGMAPILDQDKFTKFEREALYKSAGGVVLSTIEGFKAHNSLINGRVGHVIVDQQTAFGVWDNFELEILKNYVGID